VSAAGDASAAVRNAIGEFLRSIADTPSGQASASFRYVYVPGSAEADPQSRLALHVTIKSEEESRLNALAIMLEQGALSAYFRFASRPPSEIPWHKLKAVCHVIRSGYVRSALIDPRDNPKGLSHYYAWNPFESRKKASFVSLDRTLDVIEGPALIDISVARVDMREDLKCLSRYIEQLEFLDRPSAHVSDNEPDDPVFFGSQQQPGRSSRLARPTQPKRDPLAGDFAYELRDLGRSMANRCLAFNIRAFARDESTARLLASVVAESSFEDGSFALWTPSPQLDRLATEIEGVKACSVECVSNLSDSFPGEVPRVYRELQRLSCVATVPELEGLCLLPTASHYSPRVIKKDSDPPSIDPEEMLLVGHEVGFDDDEASGTKRVSPARGVPFDALTRHMFVVGTPGSGKTSELLHFVVSLWTHRRIPALVIEPTKSEYRALLQLQDSPDPKLADFGRTVRFFSPGSGLAAAYRYNPLIIPEGVTKDQKIQSVLRMLKASMALSGPMVPLLTESLYRLYEEFEHVEYPPTLDDLFEVAERVLRAKRYGPVLEANIRGAISVRLTGLLLGEAGRVHRTTVNIPSTPSYFQYPTILELNELDPEQACQVAFGVFGEIHQHARRLPYQGDAPRLVVVIEEGHLIAPRSRGTLPSEDNPDPTSFSSEYVCRMLAEFRALGIGVIVADQVPTAVDPRILKYTASTLAFRLKDAEDRDLVSAAMLLGPVEADDLVRLPPGRAYLMAPGFHTACRVRTPNAKRELGVEKPPLGEAITPYITKAPWSRGLLEDRLLAEMAVFGGRLRLLEDQQKRVREALEKHETALGYVKKKAKDKGDRASTTRDVVERSLSILRRERAQAVAYFARMKRLFEAVVPKSMPAGSTKSDAGQEWKDLRERWKVAEGAQRHLEREIQTELDKWVKSTSKESTQGKRSGT
jgi:hypothetical protein